MKNLFLLLTIFLVLINFAARSQGWIETSSGGSNFTQTDPASIVTGNVMESAGIGDFLGNTSFPTSSLHINSNWLPVTLYPKGEVFKSDCPNDISTYWRMLRGGVEYGRAYNLASEDLGEIHWNLGAPEGELRLHANKQALPDAGTYRERLRVSSGIGYLGETDVTKISLHYQGTGGSMINNYVSMLNMGDDSNFGLGVRDWMDVGTYMCKVADQMYVGIKDENPGHPDRGTAVIKWAIILKADMVQTFSSLFLHLDMEGQDQNQCIRRMDLNLPG